MLTVCFIDVGSIRPLTYLVKTLTNIGKLDMLPGIIVFYKRLVSLSLKLWDLFNPYLYS